MNCSHLGPQYSPQEPTPPNKTTISDRRSPLLSLLVRAVQETLKTYSQLLLPLVTAQWQKVNHYCRRQHLLWKQGPEAPEVI